jgi:outer membrane biosynthesis protein TonB
MLTLIVKQTTADHRTKTWKLSPGSSMFTFGSSKLSQLISIDATLESYELLISFKNNEWNVTNLNKKTTQSNFPPTQIIQKEITIQFSQSKISFDVFEKNSNLFEQLENKYSTLQKPGTLPHQLYVVKLGTRVLETKISPVDKKFIPSCTEEKIFVDPIRSNEWVKKEWNKYQVMQKTIYLSHVDDLTSINADQFIDKESRKANLAIVGMGFLIGLVAIFSPKSKHETMAVIPQSATKMIVRTDFKKSTIQKVQPAQEKVAQKAPTAGTSTDSPSAGGGKVAGLLKNLNTSRISSMLAKVSAQSAKSKNAMFGKGVVAGTAPAGRAIAALGPASKNWAADTQGKGLTISTAGVGGGNSTSGMGSLQGGKIGQGGVGLIEEESEVVGGLDRDVIASYIKTQLGQILYCYERQLSANKDLFGKVAVKFTIDPTGKVEAQNIGDTTLKNATVEGCILNKVALWKFPAPQGGTKVNVTYPFLFKSTN